jgi:hypothetical protein
MVPVTLAGRVLGGVVSVIGIGTLALFSGLITVGFWNQLGLRREQPLAPKARSPYTAGGAHLTEGSSARSTNYAPADVICPHCGHPLPRTSS